MGTTTQVVTEAGTTVDLWTPKYLAEVIGVVNEGETDPDKMIEGEIVDETEEVQGPRTFAIGSEGAEEVKDDVTESRARKEKKSKRPYVLTPYQATKIMNKARADAGLGLIQSPFMYIMANKGKFQWRYRPGDGRMEITDIPLFLDWMNSHNLRQVKRMKAAQAAAAKQRAAS